MKRSKPITAPDGRTHFDAAPPPEPRRKLLPRQEDAFHRWLLRLLDEPERR